MLLHCSPGKTLRGEFLREFLAALLALAFFLDPRATSAEPRSMMIENAKIPKALGPFMMMNDGTCTQRAGPGRSLQ